MRVARRRSAPPRLALDGLPATAAAPAIPRSRLLTADVLRVASIGLRTRRLRAALSAVGRGDRDRRDGRRAGDLRIESRQPARRAQHARDEPAHGPAWPDLLRRKRRAARIRRAGRAQPAQRAHRRRRDDHLLGQRAAQPLHRSRRNRGDHGRGGRTGAAGDAPGQGHDGSFPGRRQRTLPAGRARLRGRPAPRRRRPDRRRAPGPGLPRRNLVHRRRRARVDAAVAGNRTGRADRLPDRSPAVRARAATPAPCTCAPTPNR